MLRLNLGCGNDYREGWVNADRNPAVRTDLRLDLAAAIPFADDSVDEILLDNVLEHVPRPGFFPFIDELYRVCRHGAAIRIYVPHYSGMWAFKHLAHEVYFGVGSFDIYRVEPSFNAERYGRARFNMRKEELLFFHHNLVRFPLLSKLPINWLFNLSPLWQVFMERFQFLGFDEIHYELEVVKEQQQRDRATGVRALA